MFWIIGDKPAKSEAVEADIKRLTANPDMDGQLIRTVFEYKRKEVESVLAPAVGAGEPIYVLTHAGYDERPEAGREPWIANLWFDEFTTAMHAKFTTAGLSGRTLWFLVCHTGSDLAGFATMLSTLGVRGTTIYMPKDFMYVSTKGIPHVLPNQKDVETANAEVKKYGCEFMSITGSLDTGEGWAGVTIEADGTVTKINNDDVKEAVLDRFDSTAEGEAAL
jgi:hypothetical protein